MIRAVRVNHNNVVGCKLPQTSVKLGAESGKFSVGFFFLNANSFIVDVAVSHPRIIETSQLLQLKVVIHLPNISRMMHAAVSVCD